jgi:hypothetical protein
MSWIKTSSPGTLNGFTAYTETDSYGNDAFTKTSAIPNFIGGRVIMGTQTGSAATVDTGATVYIQISSDNTTWVTLTSVTASSSLESATSYTRAFIFDLTGKYAPYVRFYSPLTTHTSTCKWTAIIKD